MRITKLDGLRGLFSLMVVFFHLRAFTMPDWLYNSFIIRESWSFVDFFFVLSGFVISYNYSNLTSYKDFWSYMKKRFIRLYPLLIYSVTVYFIFDLIFNFIFPEFVENVDSFSELLIRYFDSILFMNSTPILGNTGGINGPSWSISAEMISYFVFGLVSILAIKSKQNLILLAIIIIGFAILVHNKYFGIFLDFRFVRGLVAFNLGYFVWFLSKYKFNLHNVWEYIGFIGLGVLFFIVNSYTGVQKSIIAILAYPIYFSLFILIFIQTSGKLSKLMDSNIFTFLGKISYSVYLNHFILILLIPTAAFKLVKIEMTALNQLMVLLVTLSITLFYSQLTYTFIELKGGKWLKNKFFKQ
ncbi:acyltransferase family protein [Maribacter antarcticus]|uniref:acyltransferase family protein n=1 Tax=Maribacter antarcticus TaxID=505250 RepID=UPI00047D36BF|nr:acyltransferase [Maribacter antarcticus]